MSSPPDFVAGPRRPCAADRFATPIASGGYLKVPFARCTDGVARHVTTLAAQHIGGFRCLDCEEPLTLRRPRHKRAHFAHRPDSLCAGETALHRYAKELLCRAKTLTLPGLRLEEEGLSLVVFKSGTYEFQSVTPEQDLGTFQPDALVTYQGAELAVEFLVSHAVDGEKRAKVQNQDLSMVEIDLSGIKAGHITADELDDAILHSTPRHWIYHRRSASAAKNLAERVTAKQKERGRRLKWHIEKVVRCNYPENWDDSATKAVQQAGLAHLIDLDVACCHWFTVPRSVWQAEALNVHAIEPSQRYAPSERHVEVKGAWPNERSLASKLPGWMIRSDLSAYSPKRLAEAGYDRSTYGSPDHAIWSYFSELHTIGVAILWAPDAQAFHVDPKLHGRLYRRIELHRLVTKLLLAAGEQDVDNIYANWSATFEINGHSPASLLEVGGDSYHTLFRRLSEIERMLSFYSRDVIDDLCGLPLAPIRQRMLDTIEAEEAERECKAREAQERRTASIINQAGDVLGIDAQEWLTRRVQPQALTISDFAGTSEEALYTAERWLLKEAERKRQDQEAANQVQAFREQLSQAAHLAFADPVRAKLFLNSGHPNLGGKHPIDHCSSEAALKYLKTLLPPRRR